MFLYVFDIYISVAWTTYHVNHILNDHCHKHKKSVFFSIAAKKITFYISVTKWRKGGRIHIVNNLYIININLLLCIVQTTERYCLLASPKLSQETYLLVCSIYGNHYVLASESRASLLLSSANAYIHLFDIISSGVHK